MAEVEKQEGQKTVVSFIVGLLIGGLLVWAFSAPATDAPTKVNNDKNGEQVDRENDEEREEDAEKGDDVDVKPSVSNEKKGDVPVVERSLNVGDGKVVVNNQSASRSIKLEKATYPIAEGWIGVRDYTDGQVGRILGVVRFSESQGLVPENIILQTPTISGREYAVVVFHDDGDRQFNPAFDRQVDTIFDTFKAE